MRTTLVLEDRLVREAKRRAASRGMTLSEVVNEALRAGLSQAPAESARFQMITFGEKLPASHREPKDLAEALEDQERPSLPR